VYLFAVKEVRVQGAGDRAIHNDYHWHVFRKEVEALKRVADKKHDYLIQLLLTYSYAGCYYLVFPWADRNMEQYWKFYEDVKDPLRSVSFATWVVSQFLGIADGIQAIHNAERRSSGRHFGRHGDLKPTNILWFRRGHQQTKECEEFGQFVISDFGLAQFHGEHSKDQVDARTVGRTETYRPPECDVRPKISPKYDIWTLGCIFLEFCTWFSKGWAGVDRFSQRREYEEQKPQPNYPHHIPGDTFFLMPNLKSHLQLKSTAKLRKARLKWAVFEVSDTVTGNSDRFISHTSEIRLCRRALSKSLPQEFRSLYEDPTTTELLYDLLEVVRNHLLRMHPDNRASCEVVVDELRKIHKRCKSEDGSSYRTSYCKHPRKPVLLNPPSDLSALSWRTSSSAPGEGSRRNSTTRPSSPELLRSKTSSPGSSPRLDEFPGNQLSPVTEKSDTPNLDQDCPALVTEGPETSHSVPKEMPSVPGEFEGIVEETQFDNERSRDAPGSSSPELQQARELEPAPREDSPTLHATHSPSQAAIGPVSPHTEPLTQALGEISSSEGRLEKKPELPTPLSKADEPVMEKFVQNPPPMHRRLRQLGGRLWTRVKSWRRG